MGINFRPLKLSLGRLDVASLMGLLDHSKSASFSESRRRALLDLNARGREAVLRKAVSKSVPFATEIKVQYVLTEGSIMNSQMETTVWEHMKHSQSLFPAIFGPKIDSKYCLGRRKSRSKIETGVDIWKIISVRHTYESLPLLWKHKMTGQGSPDNRVWEYCRTFKRLEQQARQCIKLDVHQRSQIKFGRLSDSELLWIYRSQICCWKAQHPQATTASSCKLEL